MKQIIIIALCFLLSQVLSAQDKLNVPQLTQDQKQEVLYNHVIAYAGTGISFAKSKGTSPEAYGRYIGKMFTPFWDPAGGLQAMAGQMMFILAGMHPDNQMQIVEQDAARVRFKLRNVDLSFRGGPMFGVTYDEFIDCSYGIIDEIADFMKVDFSHTASDGWYEVTLTAR